MTQMWRFWQPRKSILVLRILGVWSRDEVTGVSLKYNRRFLPSVNDGLVGRFPSQALQMLGKVEGANESEHMRSQAFQVWVVKRFDGSVLDGPVHPFGLSVCPRVIPCSIHLRATKSLDSFLLGRTDFVASLERRLAG
jgi:hypothetical protein